ncbi:MAG: hypothetical protein IPG47_11635 [Thermoflexaceae bacterium]|nr:hypothetical protein [Thermoflexaceae bacterium]
MREEPDDTLLARARGGDEAAFHALAERHLPELYDFAAHLTPDPAKAASVAVFALRRAMNTLETSTRDARAWLLTLVRDVALERLPERVEAVPAAAPIDEGLVPLEHDERVAASMAPGVHAGLGQIPLAQRSLLLLAVRHGFGAKELAAAAGMSAGSGGPLLGRLRSMGEERLKLAGLAQSCPDLAAILARESTGGVHWRDIRTAAFDHVRGCSRCRRRGDRLLPPLTVVAALATIPPDAATAAAILARLKGQWPGAVPTDGEAAPLAPTLRRRGLAWAAPLCVAAGGLAAALLLPVSPIALTRDRSISAPVILPAASDTPAQVVQVTVITPTPPPPTPTRTATASPSASASAPAGAASATGTATRAASPSPTATASSTATPTPTAPVATATPVPPTRTPVPPTATAVPPTPTVCAPSLSPNTSLVGAAPGIPSPVTLFNFGCDSVTFAVASLTEWITVDPPASNVVPPSGNVTIWFTASPPAAAGTYEGLIRVTPAGLPAFDVRVQVFRGS